MDALVLAAGRGERMNGVSPPFCKPLLPVDGVPLVVQAVDVATPLVDRVIVVVAPRNAHLISDVLGDRNVIMVVQRLPRGPGHALLTGSYAATPRSERMLVLLGDNVVSASDVRAVAEHDYAVGVRQLSTSVAHRFTRWHRTLHTWVERVPIDRDQVDQSGNAECWVGPIVVDPRQVAQVYGEDVYIEQLIGPHLTTLAPDARHVPVSSRDVGTPADYLEENGG